MRLVSPGHLPCVLALVAWSAPALAEHSQAAFPDAPNEQAAPERPQPGLRHASLPAAATAKNAPLPAETAARSPGPPPAPMATPRDRDEARAARVRHDWMLSVEGVTHAPIDMGVQAGLETPQGVRISGGVGWVPGAYMDLLTGIAGNATGNSYAKALLGQARYDGRTWRIQAGFRPFRNIGLYADVGYSRLSATGSLDLSSSGVPLLAALGGGYEATTRLDLWLVELGYEAKLADRLVLGLALGCMGTLGSTTHIVSVNGAPSSSLLGTVAAQADTALEKYGYTPTLTLRLGFDLI